MVEAAAADKTKGTDRRDNSILSSVVVWTAGSVPAAIRHLSAAKRLAFPKYRSWSRMHYDMLTVDDHVHPANAVYPSGSLPNRWSSAGGFQVQIDIGSTGQPATNTWISPTL